VGVQYHLRDSDLESLRGIFPDLRRESATYLVYGKSTLSLIGSLAASHTSSEPLLEGVKDDKIAVDTPVIIPSI